MGCIAYWHKETYGFAFYQKENKDFIHESKNYRMKQMLSVIKTLPLD
jgi:hypothetical protein